MMALDSGCSENFSAIAAYLIVSVSEKVVEGFDFNNLGFADS